MKICDLFIMYFTPAAHVNQEGWWTVRVWSVTVRRLEPLSCRNTLFEVCVRLSLSLCVFQWTAAGHLGLRGACVLCRVALVFSRAIASVLTRSELGTDFPASGRTERTECVLQRPAAVSDPQRLTQEEPHNTMSPRSMITPLLSL